MDMETLIKVEHLYRYYGHTCAVRDVSFEVRRGEVLGFLGPNGAGKSTTMQVITGNLAPTGGSVSVGGIDILERPRQAKALLGYLPEQPPLYRELTVDEFLAFCARLNRIPKPDIGAAVRAAKAHCGLAGVGHRLIGNLSKGYQQRVGIAQAIVHSPEVVVLDEPTVGLDPIQIREIRALIRELAGSHSVILSTHILPEVQATCDRVQIINRGELVLSDTVEGLAMRMESSSLLLGLRNAPAPAALREVPGVREVESTQEGRIRVHHDPADNPAERLAEAAVHNGWGLYELIPERRSLEDIFVDITQTDAAREQAA